MPPENVVGLFCPNCGSKNETADTPCGNCGFRLAEVPAPKFKGTMMLSSDKAVRDLIDAHDGRAQTQTRTDTPLPGEEPTKPFAATMTGAAGIPRPDRSGRKREMVGTVLGVAPQGLPPEELSRRPHPSAQSEPAARREELESNSEGNPTDDTVDKHAETEPPARGYAPRSEADEALSQTSTPTSEPGQAPLKRITAASPGSATANSAAEQASPEQKARRWSAWHILLCLLTFGLYALVRPKPERRSPTS